MSVRYKLLLFPSLIFILLSGCGSNNIPKYKDGYLYRGIYFGRNLSSTYKHGIRDGCETSRGIYTKSHALFNDDIDYYNGWFLGRKKCRHLLKIDENGDLVL